MLFVRDYVLAGYVNSLDATRRVDQLDRLFVVPSARMQFSVGNVGLAAQELFAERRPLIGQSRVVGQNVDRVI